MSLWVVLVVVTVVVVLALVFLGTLRAKSLDTVNFKFELTRLLGLNFEIHYRAEPARDESRALEPRRTHPHSEKGDELTG